MAICCSLHGYLLSKRSPSCIPYSQDMCVWSPARNSNRWEVAMCSLLAGVVCEGVRPTSVAGPSKAVELSGVRYLFSVGNYTRDESQAMCQARGGALVAVSSASEQVNVFQHGGFKGSAQPCSCFCAMHGCVPHHIQTSL